MAGTFLAVSLVILAIFCGLLLLWRKRRQQKEEAGIDMEVWDRKHSRQFCVSEIAALHERLEEVYARVGNKSGSSNHPRVRIRT